MGQVARIRTIKPEFPHSESMGKVSRDSRLLFVLMWTLADDSGRLRGSSRMLASLLFPYDSDVPKKIDGWLTELESENCISRYVVDGNQYIEIRNWLSHQKIDRPTLSKIPSFASAREDSCQTREDSSGDLRTKDLLNTSSSRSAMFSVWWEIWPLKVAKLAAKKAYPKAVATIMEDRKLDAGAAQDWLIERTKTFASSDKASGDFCPHPSTWLSEGRYGDDQNTWNGRRNGRSSTDSDIEHGKRILELELGTK